MSGGAVALSGSFLEAGEGGHTLRFVAKGAQSVSLSNARAWALGHLGLRNGYSLGVRRPSNHTSDWVVIQSVAEE